LTDLGKKFLQIAFTNESNTTYPTKDSEKLWTMLNKKQKENDLFSKVENIMKEFQKRQ
jgi:hypothetical protein